MLEFLLATSILSLILLINTSSSFVLLISFKTFVVRKGQKINYNNIILSRNFCTNTYVIICMTMCSFHAFESRSYSMDCFVCVYVRLAEIKMELESMLAKMFY